jgi:hypothetical protein
MTVSRRIPLSFLLAGALAVGLGLSAGSALIGTSRADAVGGAAMTRQAFAEQMRALWAGDHIVWTRCYIISAATLAANLPDTGETATRLLDNQTAIGNAFKPFYGTDAGNHLTQLLRTHILQAAQLIADAKAGDAAAVAADEAAWYANAHDIAVFLNGLNPANWPTATVEDLLDQHLDLTTTEATERLTGHYTADIAAYDQVHAEILTLADALTNGIIAQFPQRFAH